jgi:hypothetical protein
MNIKEFLEEVREHETWDSQHTSINDIVLDAWRTHNYLDGVLKGGHYAVKSIQIDIQKPVEKSAVYLTVESLPGAFEDDIG